LLIPSRAPVAGAVAAACVTEIPHSPQRQVPKSGKPAVPGTIRARCIVLPQFGQAGRTMAEQPVGRVTSSIAASSIAKVMFTCLLARRPAQFKRTIEIQTYVLDASGP
jgi:hypothetical protein